MVLIGDKVFMGVVKLKPGNLDGLRSSTVSKRGYGVGRAEMKVAKHARNPRSCRWKQKDREFKVTCMIGDSVPSNTVGGCDSCSWLSA